MKIATLAVAATAFLHLKGPDKAYLYDGEEAVGIDLFGPGSAEHGRVADRQSVRVVNRMRENDGQLDSVPVEQRRAQAAEDLAALTAGFRHIDYDGPDGKPLAGAALHSAVYLDPTLGWIVDQAQRFINDWGKFTPGSATS